MKKKYMEIAAVVILLLIGMGLRLNTPRADIPHDISFSGSIYTDEGNQCHNSRSKILYDEWYPDDWRIKNYNPVAPYLKYGIFKLFGVGMTQVRAVSHLFAFLSLLVFFLTLRTYFNFFFSMLGSTLLGINYFLVMYSKIGTFEIPMIFWMLLALFLMEKFRVTQKPYLLVLAGMSAFMAFVFKNTGAHFIFVPFGAYVLLMLFGGPDQKPALKKGLKHTALILGGVAVLFLAWMLFFYIPNREWIMSAPGKYIGNQMLPHSLQQAVDNFFGFNWKQQFWKTPIVWFLSLLFVPLFFRRLFQRKADITEIGFFLLFLSHTLFFLFMTNRPTRYLIPALPAMIFMTTLLLERMWSFSRDRSRPPAYPKWQQGVLPALDTVWLALGLNFCFIPLFSRYIYPVSRPPLTYKYLIFSLAAVLLFYLFKSLYWKFAGKLFSLKTPLRAAAAVLVLLALFINVKFYLKWNDEKTFTVLNISNELREKIDTGYIMGLTAPVAVLENRHKSLFLYPNFVQWEKDIFDRYPLTHALTANVHGEIRMYFDQWPKEMSDANLLKVYNVKDQFLHLYSFTDPYITTAAKNNGGYELTVVNPKDQPVDTRIGKIFHSSAAGFPVFIEPGKDTVTLTPGENRLSVEMDIEKPSELVTAPETLVFYLENTKWTNTLRYEGEKFPHKVGGDKRDKAASAGFTRVYRMPEGKKQQKPGFISFNPNFPLPFSKGFVVVDFHMKITGIQSRIRPLVTLDIFPHREQKAFAEKVLKAKDVKENVFENYRLCAVVPETKYLEFRVYAEGLAGIELDYIDVTYYKGGTALLY